MSREEMPGHDSNGAAFQLTMVRTDRRFDEIVTTQPVGPDAGEHLGASREGRSVRGFRFGRGGLRVSLIGGCHADEPVGPRFLRHLAAYLGTRSGEDPLLTGFEWWIIPHINPDGEVVNRSWYDDHDERFSIGTYLQRVQREPPGDDIEFGFPRGADDMEARPENRCVCDWWVRGETPFAFHATLHGMGFAAGPWFLIEPAWIDRTARLRDRCTMHTRRLGYQLHDVERRGEKGFHRIDRGFCTRPDSRAMEAYFERRGEPEMARMFRPSSMETVRRLGGDPLTLVSEMPLFITPGVGVTLGPPDPVAEEWKGRIETWRMRLQNDVDPLTIDDEAESAGLIAMPIRDQMTLQWEMIVAGLEAVAGERAPID